MLRSLPAKDCDELWRDSVQTRCELKGGAIALRPVEPDDYARLLEWQNDPEIAFWMDYRVPFQMDDIVADQQKVDGYSFMIEACGNPVGKAGLNQFRQGPGVCALHIYLDRYGRSRGWGRDTVVTLLNFAFGDLRMSRVELAMLASNGRARRVYESCGFLLEARLTGRSYRAGTWHETATMSVTNSVFRALNETRLPQQTFQ